jgi:hypothetical protein
MHAQRRSLAMIATATASEQSGIVLIGWRRLLEMRCDAMRMQVKVFRVNEGNARARSS